MQTSFSLVNKFFYFLLSLPRRFALAATALLLR